MAKPSSLRKWRATGWLPITIFGVAVVAIIAGATLDKARTRAEWAEYQRVNGPRAVDWALRLNPQLRKLKVDSVVFTQRAKSDPLLYFTAADGAKKMYTVSLGPGEQQMAGFHDQEFLMRRWEPGPERALAKSGYTKEWAVSLARARLKDIGWEAGPNVARVTPYLSGPVDAENSRVVGVLVTFAGTPSDPHHPMNVVIGIDIATNEVFELRR